MTQKEALLWAKNLYGDDVRAWTEICGLPGFYPRTRLFCIGRSHKRGRGHRRETLGVGSSWKEACERTLLHK
jgi:hypothetical protein